TFGTMAAKAAVKDAGRAMDMPYAEVDRIAKLIPATLNIELKTALKESDALRDLIAKDPRVKDLFDVAQRLEGMARHASTHAAGVVISPVALTDIVPLYKSNKDEITTQFPMNDLEKIGLLKMDFLALTTLTVLDDAIRLIKETEDAELALDQLPMDDAKTYEIFAKGLANGIFQFESSGMKDILRRFKPEKLEDLTALNALYRPGPIGGGMIDDFIKRKHGEKRVAYDLPELKEILQETLGVIVYQEQVQQIANKLAGYSLGEGDILRRAMGKKKPEEMASQREKFINGAKAKGLDEKKVAKIFDLMEQFAGYGFNKSHSAAYAYLAYVTAFLKAHYPLEFMSALLTSETSNSDKVVKYINECREMGIPLLAPDVNSSGKDFTPDGTGIRMGLRAIRNVGDGAAESIIEARRTGGAFKSLYDCCERVDLTSVNRRVLENLIKGGAMSSLGANRAQLTALIENAMDSGQRAFKDRQSGQTGLFGMMAGESEPVEHPLPPLPDWTPQQKLSSEKEVLGIYVTGHPLDEYADKVAELASHSTETLEGLEKGTEVALCGILTGIQRKRNREGKLWASLWLEDRTGRVEAMVFTTQYDRLLAALVEDQAVLVRGLVLPEDNAPPKLSVQEIVPLRVARLDLPTLISIRVGVGTNGVPDKAQALLQLFSKKPGETEVRLRLEKSRDFSVILDVTPKVRPDREFWAEVERICGPESVEILAK
ncbi:MAG TPA: DNA polymerase III subunit alpha, partial [Bryobacteraceae bacterium]